MQRAGRIEGAWTVQFIQTHFKRILQFRSPSALTVCCGAGAESNDRVKQAGITTSNIAPTVIVVQLLVTTPFMNNERRQ